MKFFKWKTFALTGIVCLIPILFGLSMWGNLPDTVAIHFDIYGKPDNFASKGFVVFGMPALMLLLQAICCVINDMNAKRFGERKKFEMATKWIVPVLSVVLQLITLGYALGWNLDIRKAVAVLVGGIFLVIGNYLPKFDRVKNMNADTEQAKKINRFIGYETVVMGLLFVISIFLPPQASVACIFLLVPYAIIAIAYGIIVTRK